MSLATENAKRWEKMKIYEAKGPTFERVAKRLSAPEAKKRYQAVEKITGVPWQFIAVTHEREASQRWDRQLGQGDPLNKKSTHIPRGRGPFKTWEDGAVDALVNCAPYAAKNKDWSVGGTLAMLEKYNGLGYANKGRPSPYIWAGTDQYSRGKYVADGVYDPNHVDTQLGCAGLLKFMGWQPKGTGAGTIAAIAVGGSAVAGYWDLFLEHWALYTGGLLTAAIVADVAIYKIRNRKITT